MMLKARFLLFMAMFGASILLNLGFFRELVRFSLKNDYSSHILLIPIISAFLIFRDRDAIFNNWQDSKAAGIAVILAGILLLASAYLSPSPDRLSLKAFSIAVVWIGAFILSFGWSSFKEAQFPLLFLVFVVPIPETLLPKILRTLQYGSADATEILFKLTGLPHFRQGLSFALPRINIEIAPQCSGIRSSMALLITSLLAAHLMLRTTWKKALFAILSFPMAMVKNAIRITTLSLLSVHIDTKYLIDSDLHHEGGILFYLSALALMLPILWLLRKSDFPRTAIERARID